MAKVAPYPAKSRKFKPTKAAAPSSSERKPKVLRGGNIEKIDGRYFLVVTDGHVCVRLPVSKDHSGEELSEGYVPAQALRLIEDGGGIFKMTPEAVQIGQARSRVVDGDWVDGEPLVQLARIEPGKSSEDPSEFPSIAERWPEKPKRTLRVALDSKLIRRLAEALGSDALTLEIDLEGIEHSEGGRAYEGPLVAWPYGKERPVAGPDGLLMPMRERIEPEKDLGGGHLADGASPRCSDR